jgi:hypothetical protein
MHIRAARTGEPGRAVGIWRASGKGKDARPWHADLGRATYGHPVAFHDRMLKQKLRTLFMYEYEAGFIAHAWNGMGRGWVQYQQHPQAGAGRGGFYISLPAQSWI